MIYALKSATVFIYACPTDASI